MTQSFHSVSCAFVFFLDLQFTAIHYEKSIYHNTIRYLHLHDGRMGYTLRQKVEERPFDAQQIGDFEKNQIRLGFVTNNSFAMNTLQQREPIFRDDRFSGAHDGPTTSWKRMQPKELWKLALR